MATFLDDQAADFDGQTLGAVIDAARATTDPDGRIVVEVRVDGEAISGSQLDAQWGEPIAGREIKLYTADPASLAIEPLEQVRDRLGEAHALQSDAADLLQQDRGAEAFTKVAEAMSVWQLAQQTVSQSAELLQLNLDELEIEGRTVPELTDATLAQLRELKGLLEAGDSVGLADALAYEWPEVTTKWESLIGGLIAEIEGDSDGPPPAHT